MLDSKFQIREERLLALQRRAGFGAGHFCAVEHQDAVGVYGLDADRVLVRFGESGFVGDGLGVEEDQVGGEAWAELAAVGEVEGGGGLAGHFADGVFEGGDFKFADVATEDAGVGAVAAGVGLAGVELADAGIAGDGDQGVGHDVLHLLFVHGVEDHGGAAGEEGVDDDIELVVERNGGGSGAE